MGLQIGELVLRTFRGRLVGVSLKVQSHVHRGWPAVDNTNGHKDTNNDAFALHSAPLALTATITMDRQRRLSPLSVWVDSGL